VDWKKFLEKTQKVYVKIKDKILNNKFYLWVFLAVATFLCFLTPSLLLYLIKDNYFLKLEDGFLALFIPLALFMAIAKNKCVYAILWMFLVMEIVQFAHLIYFGVPLNPFIIETIITEAGEIIQSGFGVITKIWYFPFLVLLPYSLLIYLYKKSSTNRKQSHWAAIFLILLMSYFPKRVLEKKSSINNMMPVNTRVSLYNSLRSFSGFFFNRLPMILSGESNKIQSNKYDKYEVERHEINSPMNIIIIFGESVNYEHMSIFGYSRETTPLLEEISKKDKNFVYKRAISSSVLTTVSSNMFFNIRREPDNKNDLFGQKTNLFRLARENGFRTVYLSAQSESLLGSLSSNYIDIILTREDIGDRKLKKQGEIYLANYFRDGIRSKFLQKDKNFVVIHQRNIHSPYKNCYKSDLARFSKYEDGKTTDEEVIDTYDNSILYNDYFWSSILDIIEKETKVPTYIFFVSDHGEVLGAKGYWGHAFLHEEVSKIPFFATFYNVDDKELKEQLESLFYPTHYEIGKVIAKKLGYKVINNNEKNGIYYINGVNLFGEAGFLTVTKDSVDKKIKIE
jgi:glucan phosphoethanolaminetransferase (alkaline phosphatase superfamily)